MASQIHKTNAVRELDNHHIFYELKTYEYDDNDLNAEKIAFDENISPSLVYKTLVLEGTQDPFLVAVIPSNCQLDLKKISKASNNKKCTMLPMKKLLEITGYIRGGCSPIGMKKTFPTYIEEMASTEERIYISGGKKGLQIILNPQDLSKVINLTFADLIEI